jgi:flagellar hook-length control protein FliK
MYFENLKKGGMTMEVTATELNINSLFKTSVVSNSKKSTSQVQDFSSVLNNTTGNAKSGNDTPATTKTSSDQKTFDVQEAAKTASDKSEDIKDDDLKAVDDAPTEEIEDEKADDTVIEEIATALNYILNQIEESLNVDEETVSTTMEDLGLSLGDLLNSDNLKELVTALSGEDSVISLVANEDLYSTLQGLTEVVDTQFETVLDNTGLSEDELNAILESLPTTENVEESEIVEVSDEPLEIIPDETLTGEIVQEADKEPVVIVQDNTTKPATTYSKLPENQTQETTETTNSLQSQDSGVDKTEKNRDDSKGYSENQGFNQNQQPLNENVSEVAADNTVRYTSDNTESIMRQLADTVKLIKEDNLTQMELQLHPSSLGTVNISLISKGGAITAQFTTQNEQVKAAIESQVAQLQNDLEQQGVKVEAIEVTVESHQMERNLDENNSRQEKEGERAEEEIKANRRANINLRDLGEDGDVLDEIQGANEATRIAMEMMSAHGNTMDMLA